MKTDNNISGRELAASIKGNVEAGIVQELNSGSRKPGLAVIIAGMDGASIYYAEMIKRAAAKISIDTHIYHEADCTETELEKLIDHLNFNEEVDGIILQLPLPKGFSRVKILDRISAEKDVDGQNSLNLGKLLSGSPAVVPATAKAVIEIIKGAGIDISGKKVVVIGRSTTVGLPAALLLLKENATVSVCHSRTADLSEYTKEADITVVSAGVPELIGAEHIKHGSCVIDVGTNEVDGKIVGDVDYDEVVKIACVSPAVGGVGALTMAFLLSNLYDLYRKNIHSN